MKDQIHIQKECHSISSSSHRKRIKLFLCSIVFVSTCLLVFSSYLSISYQVYPNGPQRHVYFFNQKHWVNGTEKRILLWTRYFYDVDWAGYVRQTLDTMCSYNCTVTVDKGTIKEANAVVFHLLDLYFWETPPKYRAPHQVWVLHNAEPPPHQYYNGRTLMYSRYVFNWTYSYKTDSTIVGTYGYSWPREKKESKVLKKQPRKNFAEGKTKMTYAVISNCVDDAGRFQYVKKLRKYTPIDLYGRCGNLICPRNNSCDAILKPYRFAIAFENSNCKGYVSEKFWSALGRESIPLVNWIPEQIPGDAPPKSYINVHEFSTMEDIAKFLDNLAVNDTEYNSYFEWRQNYHIGQGFLRGFCDLCKSLYNDSIPAQVVDYQSWLSDDTCQEWSGVKRFLCTLVSIILKRKFDSGARMSPHYTNKYIQRFQ
ncbi:alpha-(1,3)-fucosyltransferase fut-5-like isoform X1 [Ostrea edulis]|uniref:alpha-(1,3)-fucosyltransferase fut-5-like isoform X1 n=1 Tax=Ostrea edulis TaxID=37623 RepID=UPI0024AF63B5|nr:alpha-(1,3)-fucosyltransferase fut-5-like isoform X1 [Ostrea edulis]XP_048727175.2 alpha-(1,3)-fucosyltransferase fut-5-like isoform X1 [Ostrea edulis]